MESKAYMRVAGRRFSDPPPPPLCSWLLARKELWGSIAKTTGARYFQSLAMLLLCLVQLLIYLMCLTLPAFIGVIGHLTVSAAGLITTVLGFPIAESTLFGFYVIHWVIYGGTWLAHLYIARFNKARH